MELKQRCLEYFTKLQAQIITALEELDGSKFKEDSWTRFPDGSGGGGLTKVLIDGEIFEKAGVNFSAVHGTMSPELVEKLTGEKIERIFFASGVSLVLHPRNPMIPTVHANIRYIELGNSRWFGGGTDLTPYYLFDDDAVHFHTVLKTALDQLDPQYYPNYKKWCDEYFYIPHRQESRGVGGVFFDYLGRNGGDLENFWLVPKAVGDNFLEAYLPIVEKRKNTSFSKRERDFQFWRRGRYAEFNLMYDRGTLFGLKTGGRIESILMSMPPLASWLYNFEPEVDSPEARLLEVLRKPKEWA